MIRNRISWSLLGVIPEQGDESTLILWWETIGITFYYNVCGAAEILSFDSEVCSWMLQMNEQGMSPPAWPNAVFGVSSTLYSNIKHYSSNWKCSTTIDSKTPPIILSLFVMFSSFRPQYNLRYSHMTLLPNKQSLSLPLVSMEVCLLDNFKHPLTVFVRFHLVFNSDLTYVHRRPIGTLMKCTWNSGSHSNRLRTAAAPPHSLPLVIALINIYWWPTLEWSFCQT